MKKNLTRREFIKVAAITSAVALPAAGGYGLLHSVEGEYPETISPYVPEAPNELGEQKNAGQGVPILVIYNRSASNPFGRYLAEILLAEGLNCFSMTEVEALGKLPLDQFDIILLGEGSLTEEQSAILEGYVWNGGRLIAMRPDRKLNNIMGIQSESQEFEEGYIQVVAGNPITEGIAKESLQFHGAAALYQMVGAKPLAWVSPAPDVEPIFPAVTLNGYGNGLAVAWAYDLAKSVVYTRQGNPELVDNEQEAWDGIRAINMFVDWIDLDRIGIPQADEQQRLLANIILLTGTGRKPIPRIHYLPAGSKSLFVITGDSHGNPSFAIEHILKQVEQYQGRMSVYYTVFPTKRMRRSIKKVGLVLKDIRLLTDFVEDYVQSPTPGEIEIWRGRGHEFGFHPYVEAGLEEGWAGYWNEFTAMGYGPIPKTVRTHRILWKGWVETAKVQASHGIELNLDYYHWGPIFQKKDGDWVFGHFTGSGLPMRFCDENGNILNIYQQLTQIADDHMLNLHWGGVAKLDTQEAIEISKNLIQTSLDHFPAVFVGQFHVDPYAVQEKSESTERQFLQGVLDFVAAKNIPMWTAEHLLKFTKARDSLEIKQVKWDSASKTLEFAIVSPDEAELQFEVMLPADFELSLVSVSVNNQDVPFSTKQLAGLAYHVFTISSGRQQVIAKYKVMDS